MRIAIVGGGYSGLAAAWKLSACASQLTIIDCQRIGVGGASSISSGLMHPFSSSGKIAWRGEEGLHATNELIGMLPLHVRNVHPRKHLRVSEIQAKANEWHNLSLQHSQLLASETQSEGNKVLLEMKAAVTLNSKSYLQELWKLIVSRDGPCEVSWKIDQIRSPDQLNSLSQDHDAVILCCGGGLHEILGITSYSRHSSHPLDWSPTAATPQTKSPAAALQLCPLQLDKLNKLEHVQGRHLIYQLPSHMHLDNSLNSGVFLIPLDNGQVLCGATHEHYAVLPQQYRDSTVTDDCDSSDSDFPRDFFGMTCAQQLSFRMRRSLAQDSHSHGATLIAAHDHTVHVLTKLRQRAEWLWPELAGLVPLVGPPACRVVSPRSHWGRLPLMGRLRMTPTDKGATTAASSRGEATGESSAHSNVWVVTGLGSRGLLYHHLLADMLCRDITASLTASSPSFSCIPLEIRL